MRWLHLHGRSAGGHRHVLMDFVTWEFCWNEDLLKLVVGLFQAATTPLASGFSPKAIGSWLSRRGYSSGSTQK